MNPAKQSATAAIARARDSLIALSHRIHAHPEIAWPEEQSSRWLADALEDRAMR